MQLCVNNVQKWVSENGFKFSTSKTVCIHFHQQYDFPPDPNSLLGKTPIQVVREAKFLGVIFDTKLTFKNHIQYLKTSILKQLDPIHHQSLRTALGAFRTSPAQGLYIEAHEPSLTTRRLKLSLNYVLKLKYPPEKPVYSCAFEPENTKVFEESESKVPPLGIRILPHFEKSKINLNLVDDAPCWTSSLGNFQLLQSDLT